MAITASESWKGVREHKGRHACQFTDHALSARPLVLEAWTGLANVFEERLRESYGIGARLA
jgi:hypothetical protein